MGNEMSAKTPAAEKEQDYFYIEESTKLSDSRIWTLLEEYYQTTSIAAWNQIPFYPTSNAFIAESYADIIFNFLKDVSGKLNRNEPVYILEMAAGTGCFSFYLLKELVKRKDQYRSLKDLEIVYVMADFTEDNPKNWRQNARLRPFLDAGLLKFAVFRPQDDKAVREAGWEKDAPVILSSKNCVNPLIAIANYFFDSIKQDAFQIQDGKLMEARHRFACKRYPDNPHAIKFEELKKSESYLPVGKDYYEDPRINHVLKSYCADYENASILFPIGAFNCISNLLEISGNQLVLISSDKGFTSSAYVKGLREQPFVAHHGIFSYSVNYDAIRRYFIGLGGVSLNTSDDNLSVSTACNYLLKDKESLELEGSKFHFNEKVDRQNLSNYLYFLQDLITEIEPKKSNEILRACLGYIQLCNYDPIAFCLCAPRIYFALETINASQAERLLIIMDKVRENFYSVQQQYDVFYWVGRMFYGLNRLDEALKSFADSMLNFGESSSALYYTAACYEVRKDYETALRYYRDTLRLEPDCQYTQAGINRVEALLKEEKS